MYNLWVKGLMVAGAAVVGLGSRFVYKMKADNKVEQQMEKIIKKETGLDIDLSPDKDGLLDEKIIVSGSIKAPTVKKENKVK